jgi:hypothetical protein
MADVPKDIMEAARAVGHYLTPRCSGDCGHGPGGDGPRYHSIRCDRATNEVAIALLSERERRTAQGVTVPDGWALVPIEPTQAMLDEACSTAPHVIITYTEPHERDGSVPLIPIATWRAMMAARPAAPSLSTSAGGGERG